jgi:kynureninase
MLMLVGLSRALLTPLSKIVEPYQLKLQYEYLNSKLAFTYGFILSITKRVIKLFARKKAFPSDQYMFQSQVDFSWLCSNDAIVEIKRREA